MTIEKSEPTPIAIHPELLNQFAASNTATFTFTKTPESTKTTCATDGTNDFMAKVFHWVVDMNKMVAVTR